MATPAPLGIEPVRTAWVLLQGDLRAATVREDADPYQLFWARSTAMGWLGDATSPTSGSAGPSPGLWGMNDAALGAVPGGGERVAAWFQVGLDAPAAVAPLTPLLSCIGWVMAELGTLDLTAVQLVLPRPGPERSDTALHQTVGRLASGAHAFARTGERCPAEITVGTGDGALDGARLLERLRWLSQDVVRWDGLAADGTSPTSRPPTTIERVWEGGRVEHELRLDARLTAWSLDVVAWTAEQLALACLEAGTVAPLVITVRRA